MQSKEPLHENMEDTSSSRKRAASPENTQQQQQQRQRQQEDKNDRKKQRQSFAGDEEDKGDVVDRSSNNYNYNNNNNNNNNSNNNKSLKIAHLADIHIQDRRREEYAAVFELLYKSLAAEAPSLIVLAGDVFDSKTKATANNLRDVATFLMKLCEIAPVVMIAGNHDTNCLTPGALDLLTPIVENNQYLQPPQLTYLRDTGLYFVHGILWAVTATDGKKLSPDIVKADAKLNGLESVPWICLFHEEVNGGRFPNGFEMRDYRLTGSDFVLFDAALGGHIHLRQNITPRAAYCGSLIQQSIGEDHIRHGYLIWEIECSTTHAPYRTRPPRIREVNIPNYKGGYLRVVLTNGVDVTKLPTPVAPRYWEIEYDASTPKEKLDQVVKEKTKLYHMAPRVIRPMRMQCSDLSAADPTEQARLTRVQEDARSLHVHEEIIRDILGANHPRLADVIKLHRDYYGPMAGTHSGRARVRLIRLEFDNMYCFGTGNVIDFTKLEGCVSGVVAPNHAGKSSLIDALLFAIYEDCPRAPSKKNVMRLSASSCHISLEFEIDGKRGTLVKRNICARGSQYTLHYAGEDLTQGSTKATMEEMKKLTGEVDVALASAITLQGAESESLIQATPSKRKKIFEKILALSAFDQIEKSAREEETKKKASVEALEKQYQGHSLEVLHNERNCLVGKATTAEGMVNHLMALIANLENELRRADNDHMTAQLAVNKLSTQRSCLPSIPATFISLEDAEVDLRTKITAVGWASAEEAANEQLEWRGYDLTLANSPLPTPMAKPPTLTSTREAANHVREFRLKQSAMRDSLLNLKTTIQILENRLNEHKRKCEEAREFAWASALYANEVSQKHILEQEALPTDSELRARETHFAAKHAVLEDRQSKIPKDSLDELQRLSDEELRNIAASSSPPVEDARRIYDEQRAICDASKTAAPLLQKINLVSSCPGCQMTHRILSGDENHALSSACNHALEVLRNAQIVENANIVSEFRLSVQNQRQLRELRYKIEQLAKLHTKFDKWSRLNDSFRALESDRGSIIQDIACAQEKLKEVEQRFAETNKLLVKYEDLVKARLIALEAVKNAAEVCKISRLVAENRCRLEQIRRDEEAAKKNAGIALENVSKLRVDINRNRQLCSYQQFIINDAKEKNARLDVLLSLEKDRLDQLSKAKIEQETLEAYRRVIHSNGGIGEVLLERTRLELERAINMSLADTGANFVVKIEKDFEILHGFSDESAMLPVQLASGYQKFALSLAARVALWQLAAVPLPDCLIIDEGFAACDEDHLESMAQHIESLATSPNAPRLIFIVSHLDVLKNRIAKPLTIAIHPKTGNHIRNADPRLFNQMQSPSGKNNHNNNNNNIRNNNPYNNYHSSDYGNEFGNCSKNYNNTTNNNNNNNSNFENYRNYGSVDNIVNDDEHTTQHALMDCLKGTKYSNNNYDNNNSKSNICNDNINGDNFTRQQQLPQKPPEISMLNAEGERNMLGNHSVRVPPTQAAMSPVNTSKIETKEYIDISESDDEDEDEN